MGLYSPEAYEFGKQEDGRSRPRWFLLACELSAIPILPFPGSRLVESQRKEQRRLATVTSNLLKTRNLVLHMGA